MLETNTFSFNRRKKVWVKNTIYGIGSNPPGWKGWHFKIRFVARKEPLIQPYFSMAKIAYAEHVG